MKDTKSLAVQIAFLLIPVAISLAVAAILVTAVGRDPLEVVDALWKGAFKDSRKLGSVVNFWIPLTLVSIGLVVTFRAGLWNIGVEGQMMMGAIFASWGAQYILVGESLSPLLNVILIALSALGGMFWAFVVGALKIRLGVNEIFGGVALNALVNVISIYMISGPWQPRIGGSAQGTEPFPVPALLPEFSKTFPVNIFMIVLVFAAFAIVMIMLNATRWGLNSKGGRQEYALGAFARRRHGTHVDERFHGLWRAGRHRRILPRPLHLRQSAATVVGGHRLSRIAGGPALEHSFALGAADHLRFRRDFDRQHASANRALAQAGFVIGGCHARDAGPLCHSVSGRTRSIFFPRLAADASDEESGGGEIDVQE